MIEIPFLASICFVVILWAVFRVVCISRAGAVDWRFEALQLLYLFNLLVLVRCTFHPFAKADGQVQPLVFDPAAVWPLRINLIPFVKLTDYASRFDLLLNLIGNCTMFIPTGILTPLLYKNRRSLGQVLSVGAGISLGIELLQLPFAVRASDVDDLILNLAGCFIGYLLYAAIRRCRTKKAKIPA